VRLFGISIGWRDDHMAGLRAYASEQDARDAHRAAGAARRRQPSVSLHRAFKAAEQSNLTHSWTRTPTPINYRLERDLQTLRARSRDVGINTDHGAAYVRLCRDNIVGADGVVLRPRARGREGLDRDANRAVTEAWADWGTEPNCTMSRDLAWPDVCRAAVTSWVEDGEAFFRIVRGSKAGRDWPFALHQIDSELCPVGLNRNLGGGRRILLGIERDQWGRPLAYHFYKAHADGQYPTLGAYGSTVRIPADEIIHLYLIERAGQGRGVPHMVPALQRLKMLAKYDEAALVNALVGASSFAVIKTPDGDGAPMTDDPEALAEQEETGRQIIDIPEPGQAWRLADGEDIGSWSSDYPRGEYESFVAATLRGIASGFGVGYQALTGDRKGASYSSGRMEALQERDAWKALQGVFVRRFCRSVYLPWLPIALMAQQIRVGESPLPVERESKLSRHSWQPRRWDWVDPQKDLTGKKMAVELGTTTVSEIIRESGRDPDEVFEERREELKNYGDVVAGAAGGAQG
jgi:lambda family phage portal protein